mmetsp:Transcript_58541/g.96623  ORF Transcript_58541/g.96623 Transcript_58541/m.96623 type:complete len:227 (+) Transcript_58541:111-791(+)
MGGVRMFFFKRNTTKSDGPGTARTAKVPASKATKDATKRVNNSKDAGKRGDNMGPAKKVSTAPAAPTKTVEHTTATPAKAAPLSSAAAATTSATAAAAKAAASPAVKSCTAKTGTAMSATVAASSEATATATAVAGTTSQAMSAVASTMQTTSAAPPVDSETIQVTIEFDSNFNPHVRIVDATAHATRRAEAANPASLVTKLLASIEIDDDERATVVLEPMTVWHP